MKEQTDTKHGRNKLLWHIFNTQHLTDFQVNSHTSTSYFPSFFFSQIAAPAAAIVAKATGTPKASKPTKQAAARSSKSGRPSVGGQVEKAAKEVKKAAKEVKKVTGHRARLPKGFLKISFMCSRNVHGVVRLSETGP